jgi:hypothetical protein
MPDQLKQLFDQLKSENKDDKEFTKLVCEIEDSLPKMLSSKTLWSLIQ